MNDSSEPHRRLSARFSPRWANERLGSGEPGPGANRRVLVSHPEPGLGRHVPADRLASFLVRHQFIHADRLAAYERQCGDMPPGLEEIDPYAVATLEFGIVYERAVLQWFDQLPRSLTADRT